MEPADFCIRRYQEADRAAVMELNRMVLENAGAHLRSGEWDHDVKNVTAEFIATGGEFLVGEYDGRVIAMGALTRIDESTAKLRRMRVHPDNQRQGLGRLMLEQLERSALVLGFARIVLDTSIILRGAQRFYPKNGYRKTHEEETREIENDCGDRLIYFEKLLRPTCGPDH